MLQSRLVKIWDKLLIRKIWKCSVEIDFESEMLTTEFINSHEI